MLKPASKSDDMAPIEVNGRSYRWPDRPVVVICVDGCDPAYIDAASPLCQGSCRPH